MRPVVPVERSHLNAVDFQGEWEKESARTLDTSDLVESFVRNNRFVGLSIPYVYLDESHRYEPDFIVRLHGGLQVILEIKGYEFREPDRVHAKNTAARKWVSAVNNLGDYGRWGFVICREVGNLEGMLARIAESVPPGSPGGDVPMIEDAGVDT